MKTTLIASAILATLAFTPSTAEAGSRSRSSHGYCPPPVVVSPPRCYTPPPVVYHRPTIVGHGWDSYDPYRTVTRYPAPVYRGYDRYRGGYCPPVVIPRPVYRGPSCGPSYYHPAPYYRGTSGSISFRF